MPVLLVYMAGVFAFAGGEGRADALAASKPFVAALAFGWLVFMTVANIRGAAVGKWIHNIGGMSSLASVVLVLAAAAAAIAAGVQAEVPAITGVSLGGGDQLRGDVQRAGRRRAGLDDGRRDPRSAARPRRRRWPSPASISILSYVLTTAAVLLLVPVERGRRAARHHAGDRDRRRRDRGRLAGRRRWRW